MRRADGDERATANGAKDIEEDAQGGVGAPDEAAAEEGREEDDAIGELEIGAGEGELVEEPVDVEEGRRELVEDECGRVEVEEGSLQIPPSQTFVVVGRARSRLTNPNANTVSAEVACASMPHPNKSTYRTEIQKSQRK